MNTSFYIARRYLFGRSFSNIINLITGISVLVIAFVTAAMIIVLSAFNGIEELVDDVYSSFDSDIAIVPLKGKTFSTDSIKFSDIESHEFVNSFEEVIQGNVLIAFYDKQRIATLKGVNNGFIKNSGLEDRIVIGSPWVEEDEAQYAILGYGVRTEIGASLYSESFEPLTIFAPEKGKNVRKHREGSFNQAEIMVGGVYSVNAEFDSKYLLVPLSFARDMFGYVDEISVLEIDLKEGVSSAEFKNKFSSLLSDSQKFVTREEKNKLVYQASNSERLATILILSFIVVIGAFNMLASLTIIIIDKRKDIEIMNSMGANEKTILNVFFWQGMLIAISGLIIGLVLGLLLCIVQQKFGIIPLDGGIVSHYPVALNAKDVMLTAMIVLGMGFLFTWFPVRYLSKVHVFSEQKQVQEKT
ncbi:MAG: ABC transporter permease [Flavobacteriales bacterium]|nr:ABC transporter permease [Flavobacteriales bacterium]